MNDLDAIEAYKSEAYAALLDMLMIAIPNLSRDAGERLISRLDVYIDARTTAQSYD